MGDTGKVYTFDDRSGIVYEVVHPDATTPRAYPRHILMEGDGDTNKGFKIEWATVKDGLLYTGSFGKEYTRADGSVENTNNMWVKTIDPQGRCVCLSVTPIARHPPHASHFWGSIRHVDWTDNYVKLRRRMGCDFPGYVAHQCGFASCVLNQHPRLQAGTCCTKLPCGVKAGTSGYSSLAA